MNLSQKETMLLKDMAEQEKLCAEKYNRYSNEACDSSLKSLFSELQKTEENHEQTINQILSGTVPQIPAGASCAPKAPTSSSSPRQSPAEKQSDQYLCTDALSMEKHVSSVYDTGIFESRDENLRSVLNHIQKEEQQHGEAIYNYMAQNGMYQTN